MAKYLRIMNRGTCPRIMLEMFGAGTKRAKIKDPGIIGVNGTGTKYAPAAAMRLGLHLAISSTDADGPYFAAYDTIPIVHDGGTHHRLRMRYQNEYERPLMIWSEIGRNWDAPIGDDDKAVFRVLREYYSNALDEDPYPLVDVIERESDVVYAAPDRTVVYLSWHPEFEEMVLRQPERWFKRLANIPPLFKAPGIGTLYPRADPAKTRIYCQGNQAFCADESRLTSRFDWSTDEKAGLSEDREFRDQTKVYEQFYRLLSRIEDVRLARELLVWTMKREHSLEGLIFRYGGGRGAPANKALWAEAWHAQYDEDGREAVIATDHEWDQLAEFSYGKRAIEAPAALRDFLKHCGVKASRDFIPMLSDVPQYEEVIPSDAVRRKLDMLLAKMALDVPEVGGFQFYFYKPLTPEAKRQLGFAHFDKRHRPTGRIGLQIVLAGSTVDLAETIWHEVTHVVKGTTRHDLAFIDHADRQRGSFWLDKHGIPHEPRVDVENGPIGHLLAPASSAPITIEEAIASMDLALDALGSTKS